jgi:signal transduction histidine kinase
MAELGRLADQIRSAGVEVDLTVEGEPGDLPPGVDLSAFRIAQEGLTNVPKHGGGVGHVLVRYGQRAVAVEIADDGRSKRRPTAPRRSSWPGPPTPTWC